MCVVEADFYYDIFKQTLHTASTTHICDSCKGNIKVGERYQKHFAAMADEDLDGKLTARKDEAFNCGKVCMPCVEARELFQEEHDVVFNPDSFDEQLTECIGGLYYHPDTAEWCLIAMEMNKRFMQTETYKSNPQLYGKLPQLWY